MAKKKKKNKKDLDFQKVKLKVGRKLKKDINETKAEFKSRKIILKEIRSFRDDPLTSLARHSDHMSSHAKLSMLNHFNSALNPAIAKSLNKPILDSLSKFVLDVSPQVRAATTKCLKNCYNQLKRAESSTRDFILSLKPYLDCAYTHIARDITTDCHKLLNYFVDINDPQLFEPLMSVVLRRYDPNCPQRSEKDLALKLKQYYLRYRNKQATEEMILGDRVEQIPFRYYFGLDRIIHDLDGEMYLGPGEVELGASKQEENIVDKYLETIKDD